LIELAARRPAVLLTRLGRFGALGVEAALFVPADALVRPEALEDKLGRRDRRSGIGLAGHAEPLDVLDQALDALQLREGFGGCGGFWHLQFAAHFEPLHDGL